MGKVKRSLIKIDEEKCNGCGACTNGCPEGALAIVETKNGPKAKLVKENYCDGLGACMGECPTGALTIEEKLTDEYDEKGVINHIKKTAPDKLEQHIEHLKKHGMEVPDMEDTEEKLPCGCPGSMSKSWGPAKEKKTDTKTSGSACSCESELRQWPVQLMLLSPTADYFNDADIVIAADCVPFAYPNFHSEFLKGKTLVIGCPKLDDTEIYLEKLTGIFKLNNVKSVSVVHMEVPCCFGLDKLVKDAIKASGKRIPYLKTVIGIKGEVKE